MHDSKLHMAVAALLLAVAIEWSAARGLSRDPYDELVSPDRGRVASARFMRRPVGKGFSQNSHRMQTFR